MPCTPASFGASLRMIAEALDAEDDALADCLLVWLGARCRNLNLEAGGFDQVADLFHRQAKMDSGGSHHVFFDHGGAKVVCPEE